MFGLLKLFDRCLGEMKVSCSHTTILLRHLVAISLAFVLAPAFANLGGDDSAEVTEPNFVQGKQALEAKEYATAIPALKKALEIDKNNPDVHNYLGYAYRNTGDYDNAFKHYQQALALSPGTMISRFPVALAAEIRPSFSMRSMRLAALL